jgi:Na+/H+-dicarboxylate symporter
MAFAQLMNSTTGRILRIAVGLALIGIGLFAIQGIPGVGVAMVGAVPLAAGLLDFCLLAPILSVPWSGAKIRSMKQ